MWTEVKSSLPLDLATYSWKSWVLSFLEKAKAFSMPGCEAISSEASQATLKITKKLGQQKSRITKAAVTLETGQRLEDSPSRMVFGTTSAECFESVQHQLLSKPATPEGENSLFRKMHDFIYGDTHTDTHSLILISVPSATSFISVNSMMFSKFVMTRF